jgi:hypothetical protein
MSAIAGPVASGAGSPDAVADVSAEGSIRDAVVEQLSSLQQELGTAYPNSFGGLWVNDAGLTTVGIVGEQSKIKADVVKAKLLGPVKYVSVDYSEAEIRAAHIALRKFVNQEDFTLDGMQLATIAEDTVHNRVLVSIVANSDVAAAANLAKSYGPAVEFTSVDAGSIPVTCTRISCGNPMKAGLQLYNSSGGTSCMSNFSWRTKTTPYTYYLGSAGHCHSVGQAIRHPSGTGIGSVTYSSSGPSAGVDASLINIAPANASNLMYTFVGQLTTITSRETVAGAVIGEAVCSSKLSGYSCNTPGHLVQKGVDTCCAMDQFSADGQSAQGGDSGSPVFYQHKAEGIMSAMNCGSASLDCYSPVQTVEIWKNFLVMVTS